MRNTRLFWISLLLTSSVAFGQQSGDQAALQAKQAKILEELAKASARSKADKAASATTSPTSAPTTKAATTSTLETETVALDSCLTKVKAANIACAEFLSPNIAQFVKEYGTLIQGASMAVGAMADQCKGLGDMLNKGNTALGLFQVACKTAQTLCKSSCTKSMEQSKMAYLNEAKSAQEASVSEQTYAAATPAATDKALLAEKDKIKYNALTKEAAVRMQASELAIAHCAEYELSTESAVMGGIAALKGVMTAKNCESQMNASMTLDCTSANSPMYNSKNCKCGRGELSMAECQNINISASTIKPPQVSVGKSAVSGAEAGNLAPSTDGGPGGVPGDGLAASGVAGAPIEGGGGGQMGGAGGQGGGAQDGANNPRRMNANVLGGFGGGGGSGMGGTGPGYGETDPKLKAYAPGGDKDPNRTIASQLAKEVTAQGGRSNWEKVKNRYRDNIRTLISK